MFRSLGLIETAEEEAARLALAPEGSKSHYLSTLPVTINEWPRGMVIELPWEDGRRVTVVPYKYSPGGASSAKTAEETGKKKRHDRFWTVIVVESNQASYPVGGYDLSVSESELRRGKRITNFS